MKWAKGWFVESFTSDKVYKVSLAEDDITWGCSCPHWTRNVPRPTCKHIRQVMEEATNVRIDEFFTEEEFSV